MDRWEGIPWTGATAKSHDHATGQNAYSIHGGHKLAGPRSARWPVRRGGLGFPRVRAQPLELRARACAQKRPADSQIDAVWSFGTSKLAATVGCARPATARRSGTGCRRLRGRPGRSRRARPAGRCETLGPRGPEGGRSHSRAQNRRRSAGTRGSTAGADRPGDSDEVRPSWPGSAGVGAAWWCNPPRTWM